MGMQPNALFFDLDGTLVNSRADFQQALGHVLAQKHRPLTEEEYLFSIGHAWEEIYAFLQQRAPVPLSLSALEEQTYQMRLQNIQQHGPAVLPGVPQVVQRLSQQVPCALVTGSSRKEAEMLVGAMGLTASFRFLLCSGEVPRGKPAPDPYVQAAARLQVAPQACVVLEDSTVGIASARAANMFCIGLRAGNFSNQDQSAASLVLDTLLDVEAWFAKQSPAG